MTKEEFSRLPYLLRTFQVYACGYSRPTIAKYAEHGILAVVRPKGCHERLYRKQQLAQMLGWLEVIDAKAWAREKPMLGLGAVVQWTGFDKDTISAIVKAGGLTPVQPGGVGERKFRKEEIGEWLGL